jgi:putative transposase
VKQVRSAASERRICQVFRVSRSTLRLRRGAGTSQHGVDAALAARMGTLIEQRSTFGYRPLWAMLRYRDGVVINRKGVYRALRHLGWFVHQRQVTPRPRVQGWGSQTTVSHTRWAMDVTHILVGTDRWAHLAAVIDCHDREIIGYEFALRGRAREAERALKEACLSRFGTVRPTGQTPVVRSDNGLIFQSRRFRRACHDYRLSQEYVTPYTPEQNGLIERFFRSLKEECAWLLNFSSFVDAKTVMRRLIEWYNEARPHQALGDQSPREYRAQLATAVA